MSQSTNKAASHSAAPFDSHSSPNSTKKCLPIYCEYVYRINTKFEIVWEHLF